MTMDVGNLCFDAEVEVLQDLLADHGSVRKFSLPLAAGTAQRPSRDVPFMKGSCLR